MTSLLNDIMEKGVCNLTAPNGEDISSGLYEASDQCEFKPNTLIITQGTCSKSTETLLLTEKCLRSVFKSYILKQFLTPNRTARF